MTLRAPQSPQRYSTPLMIGTGVAPGGAVLAAAGGELIVLDASTNKEMYWGADAL